MINRLKELEVSSVINLLVGYFTYWNLYITAILGSFELMACFKNNIFFKNNS